MYYVHVLVVLMEQYNKTSISILGNRHLLFILLKHAMRKRSIDFIFTWELMMRKRKTSKFVHTLQ